MTPVAESRLAIDLAHALVPLKGSAGDDETLFGIIGNAPIVLVGGSTHGTHEFYRARAEITKRLVSDCGFTAVCIDGDWGDARRANRYVCGAAGDVEAAASLDDFQRFPAWTWRNADVLEFVAWLREYNDAAAGAGATKTGFFGLDRYGTSESSNPFTGENPQWRDAHMLDTLEHLFNELRAGQRPPKVVVWAHDAYAAFARRRLGDRAVAIGFTTYTGIVMAAPELHAAAERKQIVPARGDSYEYLFHATNVPRFLVPLRPHRPKLAGLPQHARQRAIGVVYDRKSELHRHYVTVSLIDRFDALYHFDVTRALVPLEGSVGPPPRSPSVEAMRVEAMGEND